MITIKGCAQTSFEVKKSKFLGFACHVQNENEIKSILEQHRKRYYDASHNCWAYLLESGAMKFSDDGEPQGTAGLPMLEVLKKSGLSDVLAVSTRYFGGTLLGAGGLARAYSKSTSDSLSAAQKVELIPCGIFICSFPYDVWAKAEKPLREAGFIPEDINYSNDVTASVLVRRGEEQSFSELVTGVSQGRVSPTFKEERLSELPR